MRYIYDELKKYAGSDYYPFHMPGHKRRAEAFSDPFLIDITEIEGFDNLHHAEGLIEEAQRRAAALYQSANTFFLINGSTSGILSAVSACTSIGGKLLMARNCHKAVYHSALLRELEIIYTYPQQEGKSGLNCGLNPDSIEELLISHPDIQVVIITSPTYDGIVSDVAKIAAAAHRHGKPLIVDEAHGAHFGFHPYFPENSIKCGADIVIHSLHKTLPSFTQTALLHLNGTLINEDKVKQYLGIYQSSSPSYVLMAGIDNCIRTVAEQREFLFGGLAGKLEAFRTKMGSLSHILVIGDEIVGMHHICGLDRSKLILIVRDGLLDGKQLYEILLEKYHLQLEMAAGGYALAITSVGDDQVGFERLYQALKEIDEGLDEDEETTNSLDIPSEMIQNEAVMRISEANNSEKMSIPFELSLGFISGEFVYLYPPGIPLIVPGEKISEKFLAKLLQYRKTGFEIQGIKDFEMKNIEVLV